MLFVIINNIKVPAEFVDPLTGKIINRPVKLGEFVYDESSLERLGGAYAVSGRLDRLRFSIVNFLKLNPSLVHPDFFHFNKKFLSIPLNNIEVPAEFVDPLTDKIIINPVRVDGIVYDESTVDSLVGTCLTRDGLDKFRDDVKKFLKANPSLNHSDYAHVSKGKRDFSYSLKVGESARSIHGYLQAVIIDGDHVELVKQCLEKHPDFELDPKPDSTSMVFTPLLIFAAVWGRVKVVDFLLTCSKKANINAQHPDTGCTALLAVACRLKEDSKFFPMVLKFLAHNPDLEIKDKRGNQAKEILEYYMRFNAVFAKQAEIHLQRISKSKAREEKEKTSVFTTGGEPTASDSPARGGAGAATDEDSPLSAGVRAAKDSVPHRVCEEEDFVLPGATLGR